MRRAAPPPSSGNAAMPFARPLAAAALAAAIAGPAAAAASASSAPPTYVVASRATFDGAGASARAAQPWTDALGRALVVAEVDAAGLAALSRHVHEHERRCGGFFAFASRQEAEAFIARDRTASAIARPLGGLYTIDNHATVDAWLPEAAEANIRATIGALSAFRNRYYATGYGRQAAEWIGDAWQALAAGRDDASVELFTGCTNCSTQPSVILTVRGNELANEVVVVGGHLDSINGGNSGNPEQVAPGADDDASGIATITEIARIALAGGWKPKRTVKFMGYAAEEVGLRGSEAIARRFAADGVDVVGVLQLDMTNYKDGAPYDMQLISDYSNAALKAYFGELFDEYLAPLGLARTSVACNYGCSDHASWTSAGFPAGMMFEAGRPRDESDPWDLGDFPYIHTSGDTLANMGDSAEHSVKFAKFGLAFVGELAKTHDDGAPVNTAPTASFTYGAERMTVRFTDTSTDSDGTIVSRLWDFGDGDTSGEANPTKTFAAVGAHVVSLTVTDDGGLPNATFASVAVDNGIVPLANGQPASGLPALQDAEQTFTLDVPPGATGLRFLVTGSPSEDADLAITLDGRTVCEAQGPTANEVCTIADPPAPGTYAATVHAYTALGGFTITGAFTATIDDRIFGDGFDPENR
jgi:leucyl aminopeptidase